VPYSQRYLVLGLVGLALWLVSVIELNKYRCEYGIRFSGIALRGVYTAGTGTRFLATGKPSARF